MIDRKMLPMKTDVKYFQSSLTTILALSVLFAGMPAFAAPPDAGRLLEEVRPAPALPQPKVPATRVEEQAPASAPDGIRFAVKGVHISGQSVFTEAELLVLVSDSVGKELSMDDLNKLAERITLHYRQRGYLMARAYLPAQEIRDGQVEIAVLEGRLGKVEVNNTAGLASSVLAQVSSLPPGKPLRVNELEGSLLTLADIPGVEVKSTLRPGEAIGTSDLLVEVAPGKEVNGSIDFDTYGNRYVGANRIGASLYFNNPLKRGDQLSIRLQTSGEGLDYSHAGYQLPVGNAGTRIGVAWSEMSYRLGREFAALATNGEASVGSVHAQHPLLRRRALNLYGQARFETKRLTDRIGISATQMDKALDNWTAGFNGNNADGLGWGGGSGGSNSFALSYTKGNLGLDAVSLVIDGATAQSSGRFGKISGSFQRLQRLPGAASLYFSFAGQRADKNLDSAEKFSLGGIYGVRAYPQGEANGDEGQLLTAELRWRANDAWQFKGFYDDGRTKINRKPWVAGNNDRHLTGVGMGAVYDTGKVSTSLLAAWRAGTGSPTSDTDRKPRIWFQAVKYF